jgi:hypothetical protein
MKMFSQVLTYLVLYFFYWLHPLRQLKTEQLPLEEHGWNNKNSYVSRQCDWFCDFGKSNGTYYVQRTL